MKSKVLFLEKKVQDLESKVFKVKFDETRIEKIQQVFKNEHSDKIDISTIIKLFGPGSANRDLVIKK